MFKSLLTLLFSLFLHSILLGQSNVTNSQPAEGPGSANYQHQSVKQYDFAQKQDGYWLFEPAAPRPDSANVIVFTHGYGGYNPMIYGQWIKHLVLKGNIVIFPRYQKNIYLPRPNKFSENVSKAIRDAIQEMKKGKLVRPILKNLALVGHSYGGVISADLAVNFNPHGIPKPVAAFLVSPGTGPLKGGVLDTYEGMPEDLKLVVMVSQNDYVVGDSFGKMVFNSAKKVIQRNFIRQYSDYSASPNHHSGHNESYALDKSFDSGKSNVTTRRALRIGKTNNIDYYGYWKIFDALLDCSREGENCEFAFGNTPEQRYLGLDTKGKPVRELEVTLPPSSDIPSISSQ